MNFDFENLTIPIGRWTTVWAQCMEDGYTRELWVGTETESCLVGYAEGKERTMEDGYTRELWVGTETESCLVGYAEGKERTMEAVCELLNMMEAAKVLRGTT